MPGPGLFKKAASPKPDAASFLAELFETVGSDSAHTKLISKQKNHLLREALSLIVTDLQNLKNRSKHWLLFAHQYFPQVEDDVLQQLFKACVENDCLPTSEQLSFINENDKHKFALLLKFCSIQISIYKVVDSYIHFGNKIHHALVKRGSAPRSLEELQARAGSGLFISPTPGV